MTDQVNDWRELANASYRTREQVIRVPIPGETYTKVLAMAKSMRDAGFKAGTGDVIVALVHIGLRWADTRDLEGGPGLDHGVREEGL